MGQRRTTAHAALPVENATPDPDKDFPPRLTGSDKANRLSPRALPKNIRPAPIAVPQMEEGPQRPDHFPILPRSPPPAASPSAPKLENGLVHLLSPPRRSDSGDRFLDRSSHSFARRSCGGCA